MSTNPGSTLGAGGRDLTDVLDDAKRRGYGRNLSYSDGALHCEATGDRFDSKTSWIAESTTVDMGTDPGDDSTVYLIESEDGHRGYVVVPASFYTDPAKAEFIHRLKAHPRSARRGLT
jgi:hypothetical protein